MFKYHDIMYDFSETINVITLFDLHIWRWNFEQQYTKWNWTWMSNRYLIELAGEGKTNFVWFEMYIFTGDSYFGAWPWNLNTQWYVCCFPQMSVAGSRIWDCRLGVHDLTDGRTDGCTGQPSEPAPAGSILVPRSIQVITPIDRQSHTPHNL